MGPTSPTESTSMQLASTDGGSKSMRKDTKSTIRSVSDNQISASLSRKKAKKKSKEMLAMQEKMKSVERAMDKRRGSLDNGLLMGKSDAQILQEEVDLFVSKMVLLPEKLKDGLARTDAPGSSCVKSVLFKAFTNLLILGNVMFVAVQAQDAVD